MKRKASIILCVIFALILLIPLALTDVPGGGISQDENRQLAAFPQVISRNGIHLRALGGLDDWIDDNIGLRREAQKLYTDFFVKGLHISSSDKVYFGNEGWYFYTLDSNLEVGTGTYLLSDEQLKTIADNQQQIADYYAALGTDYVLVLTPSKASVYPEHVAEGLIPGYTMIDQLTDYLRKHTSVCVVNTKDALLTAKDDGQLFWKTDTHWTQLGSYEAYKAILKTFRDEGFAAGGPVNARFVDTVAWPGEFNAMLGDNRLLGDETVPESAQIGTIGSRITSGQQYDTLVDVQLRLEPNYPAVIFENSAAPSGELLILGDSQWEMIRNMPQYFSHNFSRVVSMRADSPDWEIDTATASDVFLFACSERFIDVKLTRDVPGYIRDAAPAHDLSAALEVRQIEEANACIGHVNGVEQGKVHTLQLLALPEGSYQLTGWAADLEAGTALSELYVKAGERVFRCRYGMEDHTVSDAYHNEALQNTAFSVTVPASALENGAVSELQLLEISKDGSYRYEESYPIEYLESNDEQAALWNLPDSGTVITLWVDDCNGIPQHDQGLIHLAGERGEDLLLTGWAADTEHMRALGALTAKVGNDLYPCQYGDERQAVVDYFGAEELRYVGFSVTIPAKACVESDQITFVAVSDDGKTSYQRVNYRLDGEAVAVETAPTDAPSSVHPSTNGKAILSLFGLILLAVGGVWLLFRSNEALRTKYQKNEFLFSELVKRDFTLKYKRTVLGMLWSMLSPLFNLLIMWLVFNKMLGSNINHFVIYMFAGQLIFSYFSEATNTGMTSLLDNAGIFTKVNVPKYLFVFSRNISAFINFCITLLLFFLFTAMEGIPFSWNFLMLLYPIACLVLINLGMGMILSALFVFFRDMQYLWGLALQLIMWMSAIFYGIDGFDPKIQHLFHLNPLYLCIRYFRSVVIDGLVPSLGYHAVMLLYSAALFGIGCWMYKKHNTRFLYYV